MKVLLYTADRRVGDRTPICTQEYGSETPQVGDTVRHGQVKYRVVERVWPTGDTGVALELRLELLSSGARPA